MSCGLTASTTTSAPLIASAFDGRRLDTVPLVQLGGALLAPRAGDDVGPVGATQPGEQRLADLAGAEDRDPHHASLRVRRGIPPAGRRSRARPTRRRARAARRSPRARRAGRPSAEASLTSPRSRARPRSSRPSPSRQTTPTDQGPSPRSRSSRRATSSVGWSRSASRSSDRQRRTSAAPRRAPRPRPRELGRREAPPARRAVGAAWSPSSSALVAPG